MKLPWVSRWQYRTMRPLTRLAITQKIKKWDGKYRSIKVKLARDGLQLRHRRGYFGIDPSQQKDRKPEQQVAEALRDNAPSTLVTFSAQVKPGEKGKLAIAFLVDANSLSAEDVSGGKKLS